MWWRTSGWRREGAPFSSVVLPPCASHSPSQRFFASLNAPVFRPQPRANLARIGVLVWTACPLFSSRRALCLDSLSWQGLGNYWGSPSSLASVRLSGCQCGFREWGPRCKLPRCLISVVWFYLEFGRAHAATFATVTFHLAACLVRKLPHRCLFGTGCCTEPPLWSHSLTRR